MTRTEELTLKLLDGSLSDAEGRELDSLLGTDPSAVTEHLSILDLEATLRGLRTDFDLSGPTMERVTAVQAEQTTSAVMAEIAALPPPGWAAPPASAMSRYGRRRWAVFASLAASAAAIALFVAQREGEPPPLPEEAVPPPHVVAAVPSFTLTQVLGSVEVLAPTGEVEPAETGRTVAPGQSVRTVGEDSFAVVELPDRTRVEIEPDTTVRFPALPGDGGRWARVVLTQGQLKADVPARQKTDRPMVVSTPAADVMSRGGSFVLSSVGPESARIEPMEGCVQVVQSEPAKPVSVRAGGAAVIETGLFGRVTVEHTYRVSTTPRRKLSFEAYPGIRDVTFAPDGKEIWAATGKQLVRWTADGGTADHPFYQRKGGDGVTALFTADRKTLVTFRGEKDDGLVVRHLPEGEERATVNTRVQDRRFFTAAPAGVWLATVDPKANRKLVSVWDGDGGGVRFSQELEDPVTCLTASPDGAALAVGITDTGNRTHNRIVFLHPVTGERLFALPTQKRGVTAMAFSADGRSLAVGFTGLVQVWDVRSRDLVRTISGFERVLTCLTCSADGRRLAAGTQDGQVWVWSARTGNVVQRIEVGGRAVRAIAFSPDGRALVTATNKAPVSVWDVAPETAADRDGGL